MVFHHVVAEHDGEHGLVGVNAADDTQQVLLHLLAYAEGKVLDRCCRHGQDGAHDGHAVLYHRLLEQGVLGTLHGFGLHALDLLAHGVVLVDIFCYHRLQVLGVVEEGADGAYAVLQVVEKVLTLLARLCLDTSDAGCHAALADDLEHADAACRLGMDAATELAARTETHHAHGVAIFLAEESHGAKLLGFLHGHVAVLVESIVGADHAVHDLLHLTQLLVGDLLEVGEVEAQGVGRHIGTLLLHMVAEDLLQGIVDKVCGGVVGSAGIALVGVYARHEVGINVLGQLLHDVYALVVLALGVGHGHGLVLAHEHALVAYLSAHLTVERCVVEHQLVERALLLCHLAVAQDVTLVLGVVVAHKLLLALAQNHPVAVLNGSGVACALLLLLHLGVKLLLVDGVAVFAAYQLGEVEREAVGVEHAEGLCTVEHGLAVGFQLVHGAVEQVDAFLQGAEERVFLFFHDACDELLLSGELGEGVAHLLHEHRHELIHERLFLVEEGVGVAHGAAQDAADHIACLGVAGQLAVGNGEGNGTQVVGAHAHGHVGVFVIAIFLACDVFLFLDDGLEDVGVIVGMFVLQGADQTLEAHAGIDNVHGQGNERAVGLALILHEHDVPDLDDLWVVFVDKLTSGNLGLLLGCARVEVYL